MCCMVESFMSGLGFTQRMLLFSATILSNCLPLDDEFCKGALNVISGCLICSNNMISFVAS